MKSEKDVTFHIRKQKKGVIWVVKRYSKTA